MKKIKKVVRNSLFNSKKKSDKNHTKTCRNVGAGAFTKFGSYTKINRVAQSQGAFCREAFDRMPYSK